MRDITDILNRMRQNTPHTSVVRCPNPPIQAQPEPVVEQPVEPESPAQTLTDDDFSDILESYGIQSEAEHQEEREEEPLEVQVQSLVNNSVISEATAEPALQERTEESDPDFEPEEEEQESFEEVPQNSPTLSVDESTSRFSGTLWYNEVQNKDVIIAGLGGIGSNLAYQIARMKPAKLVLYDSDNVETANLSGQMFSYNDQGLNKADAIYHRILNMTHTCNVYSLCRRFTRSSAPGDIMMCGFDNMEARRIFFESWRDHVNGYDIEARKRCLFLDGRLSVNTLQVFCITGNDAFYMQEYADKHLFDSSEADDTVCSMKQTTYLACMIGSIMANLFVNFNANLCDPIIPYDLPFFIEYDAENMIFKTRK